MVKVKVGDVVRIDWQDHFSTSSSWRDFPDPPDQQLIEMICSTVGLVVKEDKHQIALAMNWHHQVAPEGTRKFSDCMVIIKGCIRKITMIKKGEFK